MDVASQTRLIDETRKQLLEGENKLKATRGIINHEIAVISSKGGVGKSTISANFGIATDRFVMANAECPASKAFMEIAKKIDAFPADKEKQNQSQSS